MQTCSCSTLAIVLSALQQAGIGSFQTASTHSPFERMPRSHIKRPMNAFMLWARDNRPKFIERHPELHNADISRLLGSAWSNRVDESTRTYYNEMAKRVAEEHRRQFPDYKCVVVFVVLHRWYTVTSISHTHLHTC